MADHRWSVVKKYYTLPPLPPPKKQEKKDIEKFPKKNKSLRNSRESLGIVRVN